MQMKVFNRLAYFSLVFIVFSVAPVFAAGNLTVTNGTLSPFSSSGDFWNSGLNVILNVSLNSTVGEINNLTSILINFTGNANVSNITAVFIYNDTDNDAIIDPDETQLGSNSSLNISRNFSVVPFTVNFTVPLNTKRNILIAFNISATGRFSTTGVQIASNRSIITSNLNLSGGANELDNVTISTGSVNSTVKTILDMHANATLSPRIVDTNVTEQMLVYTITPTSQEKINRTKVIVPTGYSLINVTEVKVGTTVYTRDFSGTPGDGIAGVNLGSTEFNVTFAAPGQTSTIKINFTVNTNLTTQSSVAFTSKVFSNISFINPDVFNEETNVTTVQIIQILSVGGNKTAALLNGTDYWEFTFKLNFTANVSGSIQFKMNNWTGPSGTINLTNGTVFYASIRNDTTITNSTKIANVTDSYNTTQVIPFNVTADATTENTVTKLKHLVLRMTIPSNIPVSSGWWTVYSIIFRSNPT